MVMSVVTYNACNPYVELLGIGACYQILLYTYFIFSTQFPGSRFFGGWGLRNNSPNLGVGTNGTQTGQ